MASFLWDIVVSEDDLDHLKHVNNVRYLNWVQEVSGKHWELLQPEDWPKNWVWVVRSHKIDYLTAATLGQNLRVFTQVQDVKGPLSHRKVEIHNTISQKLVASCLTQWCLFDWVTQRPIRIPQSAEILLLSD